MGALDEHLSFRMCCRAGLCPALVIDAGWSRRLLLDNQTIHQLARVVRLRQVCVQCGVVRSEK